MENFYKKVDAKLREFSKQPAYKRVKKYSNRATNIVTIPWDWRFNSILYASDVANVLDELCYELCRMKAAHECYVAQQSSPSRPRHVPFLLNLVIGNILFRAPALIEKLFLAFACYFNYHDPTKFKGKKKDNLREELQRELLKREKTPLKKVLKKFLNLITKEPAHWKKIKEYRHMKIHYLEPKVDAYDVRPEHDWVFTKRISKKQALAIAENKFQTGYPVEERKQFSAARKKRHIEFYLSNQKIGKHYYSWIRPDDRLIEYKVFELLAKRCTDDLLNIVGDFFSALAQSEPFASSR